MSTVVETASSVPFEEPIVKRLRLTVRYRIPDLNLTQLLMLCL